MNIYLAIITTVLVVTQIIRVCQNHIQLRRQHILFKKQLGQLADCEPTKEDFETQRKAYRLIVEHFEGKKMPPPLIREEKKNVVKITAETEMLDARVLPDADAVAKQLQKELGKAVYPFAKVTERSNPNDISYCYRAEAYVVDKGD